MKKEPFDEKEISFEEAYRQLEALVGMLESGQCELEASLESYEKGIALLRICRQKLAGVSRRVELLKGVDEQGAPVLEQLDEATLSSRNDVAGRQNSGTKTTESRATSNAPSNFRTPSASAPNERRVDENGERRAPQTNEPPGRAVRPDDETIQRKRASVRRSRYDGSSSLFDADVAPENRSEQTPQTPRNRSFFDSSGEPPF